MSESITLEIPDEVVVSARAMAAAANRSLEETLLDWIRSAAEAPPPESLPDTLLLKACDEHLGDRQQALLSDLLERQRESALSQADQTRLDVLMSEYRRGLVLKARALQEAVRRGLRPPLVQPSE